MCIRDRYVVAAKCGIGKVFAAICAEAMILKYDVDMIVNIGAVSYTHLDVYKRQLENLVRLDHLQQRQ